MKIGAGHTFIILFKNAFPINVSNAIKTVVEVSEIFCATANNVEVIIAKSNNKSAVLGVIDGEDVVDIENNKDKAIRRNFVRKIGYKLK